MSDAPQNIQNYLDALKRALKGAPPGLIADALADTEDHLRGAMAAEPGRSEAEIFAEMAASYGSPEEVAAEYRASEAAAAGPFANPPSLETGAPAPVIAVPRKRFYSGFFGVAADPLTYGALLYMLLALAIGVFYFTWTVVGLSLSLGFLILIIGIPFFLLFVGSVRLLSHLEGRIVEALLGVRMPRRLPASSQYLSFWNRVKDALADRRTWSSIAYMQLMLPLGVAYFVAATVGLSLSVGLAGLGAWDIFNFNHVRAMPPAAELTGLNITGHDGTVFIGPGPGWMMPLAHTPVPGLIAMVLGVVLFFVVLHAARLIGRLHGRVAEHLLVRL